MERFTRTLHGYNPEEVNKFLDDVIKQVEKIINSNKQKEKEIESLKKQINEIDNKVIDELTIAKAKKFDELQNTLNEAVNVAKSTGEHIKVVAKQERNLILEEARRNADAIINDVINKSSKIEYQANLLKRNIISFKRKLKINLEEQMQLVDEIEIIDIENKW